VAVATKLGCKGASDKSCLQQASAAALLTAFNQEIESPGFMTTLDGEVYLDYALTKFRNGEFNRVPLIIGPNGEDPARTRRGPGDR
jgi:carboxylesterase type B